MATAIGNITLICDDIDDYLRVINDVENGANASKFANISLDEANLKLTFDYTDSA